jgi:CHAT domain-containing protein
MDHCGETLSSQSTGRPTLVAIGNPLPSKVRPLLFGRAEAEEVSMVFEDKSQLFCEVDAKRFDPKTSMSSATYIHFACHGSYDPASPLSSAVILARGKRLTLADLYAQPLLKETRLVVLSACQTAIADFDKLPEEAIGLPGGFLRAGVPGVVGSLWPVDDLSTTLLMIKFYEYHLKGKPDEGISPMPPVQAMRRAQMWLRDVTSNELGGLFDMYRKRGLDRPGIPQALANEKFVEYTVYKPQGLRPFEDCYHWAAFAYYGI